MGNFRSNQPLGTTDVKVLLGNSSHLDVVANSKEEESTPDRFGMARKTLWGMECDFQSFLVNSGYQDMGDYAADLELTARNQMFHKDGELYRASAALALPYTLIGDWDQEKNLFVGMGDQVLRQSLSSGSAVDSGAALISASRFPLSARRVGLGGAIDSTVVNLWELRALAADSNKDISDWDFSAALQHIADTYDGVEFPPGIEFNVLSEIVIPQGKSFFIQGNGAKIKISGNRLLRALNTADFNVPVTALQNTQYVLAADSSTITSCVKITCPGHSFKAGDIGRIYSNDPIPDAAQPEQTCAEYFSVGAVVGDDIYTTGRFFEAYTTGIRVVRPSKAKIDFRNFTVESTSSDEKETAILVGGYINPKIKDLSGVGLAAQFIAPMGCLAPDVEGVTVQQFKNDPTTASYGYGVNDSGNMLTSIDKLFGSNCRHVYTTSTPSTTDASNWIARGRTIGSTVTGRALGGAAAFDTHEGALGVRFINCVSYSDYRGTELGGSAFTIRGHRCEIIDPKVQNSKAAVIMVPTNGNFVQRLLIKGLSYIGPADHTPLVLTGRSDAPAEVEIIDPRIETRALYALDCTNARVTVNGGSISLLSESESPNQHVFSLRQGADITCVGTRVICGGAGRKIIFFHKHSNTHSCSSNVTVTRSDLLGSFANMGGGTGVGTHLSINVDHGIRLFSGDGVSDCFGDYVINNRSRPMASILGDVKAGLLSFLKSSEPRILCVLKVSGKTEISSFSSGAFQGQTVFLFNDSTSTGDVSIVSTGNILSSGARSIPAGGAAQFIWAGPAWRMVL